MQLLRMCMQQEQEEFIILRCRATECAGVVALAVGPLLSLVHPSCSSFSLSRKTSIWPPISASSLCCSVPLADLSVLLNMSLTPCSLSFFLSLCYCLYSLVHVAHWGQAKRCSVRWCPSSSTWPSLDSASALHTSSNCGTPLSLSLSVSVCVVM